MFKMTKPQRKMRSTIESWLRGEAELTPDEVRNKYIPSWDPVPMGEFYTPPSMVQQAHSLLFFPQGARILDPCAGIGALVKPFAEAHSDWKYEVVAYELQYEAAQVLGRLYPNIKSDHADVFDRLPEIEGKFDYVVMNPPFGALAGQESAAAQCASGSTRSEHRFLELAVRALRAGGLAIVIAPPVFMGNFPRKAQEWFDERMSVETHQPLKGKFQSTSISVEAFVIHRFEEPTHQLSLL